MQPVIELSQISKCYRIYERPEDRLKQMLVRGRHQYFREFTAIKDISLEIMPGETVGLVGSNGSGKSTLLQIICGTLAPTGGQSQVNGRISALLELGAGFNPDFSGMENIYLNAAILGLSEAETRERYSAIVEFSGLEEAHLRQPVRTYSSGMYVRLAFSVATAVEPDILVVDEALAVGDEAFQRKCYARLKELKKGGTTILFVSHAAQTIIELCDRAILLDSGEILTQGAPKQVIADYHRLIFAPKERRPAIRRALKSGMHLHDTSAEMAEEQFDHELHSESRIEYAPQGGRIDDIRLTNLSGQPVNLLKTGERYIYSYRVRYEEEAICPQFGMLIKNKRGLNLGGGVNKQYIERTFIQGDMVEVRFTFICALRPGTYFCNAGATRRIKDEDSFVHRVIDALQFKVIDEKETDQLRPSGLVDLSMQGEIVLTRPAAAANFS